MIKQAKYGNVQYVTTENQFNRIQVLRHNDSYRGKRTKQTKELI